MVGKRGLIMTIRVIILFVNEDGGFAGGGHVNISLTDSNNLAGESMRGWIMTYV